MNLDTTNPARLVTALDAKLSHEVSLVIYGRAALALGFQRTKETFASTKDIDAIIRLNELEALVNDWRFWDARDAVNLEFEKEGLYITHLFQEDQVFLRPEWEQYIVPVVRPSTRWLKLYRPHTIDLILTKMMRGNDELDMEDVAFMVEHDCITPEQMEPALATVRLPDIPELRSAFQAALPVVRQILAQV